MRILLVDDHDDTRRAMQRLLDRAGHTTSVAASSAEAIELARHQKFDLLISDIGLPEVSGLELLTRLRSIQPLPAIALSGFSRNEDVERSHAAGFSEHLIKPISFPDLEAVISRIINAPAPIRS